jgi:hypothetical protein
MKQLLSLTEPAGFHRNSEYFEFSIPYAQGTLHPSEHVQLLDPGGQSFPVQVKPLAFWHDGSVKWLHGVGRADVPAHATVAYSLETVSAPPYPPFARQIQLVQHNDAWEIHTGAARFTLPTSHLSPFSSVQCGPDQDICLKTSSCTLLDQHHQKLTPTIAQLHWGRTRAASCDCLHQGAFQPSG